MQSLSPDLARHWRMCVDFHRHACPGLALGCRTALDAMRLLGLEGPSVDEEVVCVAETDSCAVDAIQVITGCTAGKGNLLFRLRGKHVFSFFTRETGRTVRIAWDGLPRELSREERAARFLTAPAGELYVTGLPAYSLPERTSGMPSLTCAACGEKMTEPYARLRDGLSFCLDCYSPPLRAFL